MDNITKHILKQLDLSKGIFQILVESNQVKKMEVTKNDSTIEIKLTALSEEVQDHFTIGLEFTPQLLFSKTGQPRIAEYILEQLEDAEKVFVEKRKG